MVFNGSFEVLAASSAILDHLEAKVAPSGAISGHLEAKASPSEAILSHLEAKVAPSSPWDSKMTPQDLKNEPPRPKITKKVTPKVIKSNPKNI